MTLVGLETVALVEGGIAAGGVAAISAHFAVVRRRTTREAPRRALAHDLLRSTALGAADPAAAASALRRLPVRAQVAVLAELVGPLGGVERERMAESAQAAGLISRAERWCTSRRWWRRLRGVRLLGLLGRGDDVVPRLLHDANPDVRAEAAAWAAGSRSPAVVERLLELLEDPETLCRFAVKDSLLRLGEPVVDPLARRLPILEGVALREALTIAAALAEPRLRDPALALLGHRDPAVRALASDVVGRIGGVAAAERVAELLSDPDPAPRAAAARALGHLGHWRTAAQLTPLLRDPAWDVRRAAGVALRGLGAPGTLLLRRALADADPFAADMARQLLELPPAVTSEELG